MALNRYRLRHLVQSSRSARVASDLLAQTDQLLGVVLLGNNVINAASALLVGEIARRLMATQIARDERLRQADDVISNDSDIDALRDAVRKLHACYLELSRR